MNVTVCVEGGGDASTLSPPLRKHLERTVAKARDIAETGARVALESLAVPDREPYEHMGQEQRALRNRLRAHGGQLGDRRHASTGEQAIDHLVHECAYEQWHSMLFARFLAENHLLIEPQSGVAVTLDECEELAHEEGLDPWALAARFAYRMLPQVFRPDHPAFELQLAREHRLQLERLVEELPAAIFGASDALGWVYQFWQTRKKEEVNRSEVKIGAEQLPAVTQLFTEPYMVQFLLDNSLGAWWAARRLNASEVNGSTSEADLRQAASIPGVPLDYLRFARDDGPDRTTAWRPAAGAFDAWPQHLSELRVIDPCCGSGHFLVAAFSMLVPMRIEREGLSARDAVDAVLRDNLYGLELDQRCIELAAFALALTAWRYSGTKGYRTLPELNLACCGNAPNATREQWIAMAEQAAAAVGMPAERDLFGVDDSLVSEPLRNGLAALHDLFQHAPECGSLIDPRGLRAELFQRDYESVRELFAAALAHERSTDEQFEQAVAAHGMARAAELLAGRYHLVATNVPYLTRGKQEQTLRNFCERYHSLAKQDLATVFLERCLALCAEGGTASLVLPQNWLFLKRYQRLREKLLKAETWHLLARLGPGAFETITGEVVKAVLLTLSRGNPAAQPADPFGPATAPGTMYGFDVSDSRTASDKAARLPTAELTSILQARQFENPDARVLLRTDEGRTWLFEFADYSRGICTGDDLCFVRCFWELPNAVDPDWSWQHSTTSATAGYGGQHRVLRWSDGNKSLVEIVSARLDGHIGQWIRGRKVWNEQGVVISPTGHIRAALYLGNHFDANSLVIKPKKADHLPAVWAYCSSAQYHDDVREVDDALKVGDALVKVAFDLDHWTRVANQQYPSGVPLPYSDDPTQWIFHGHPCGSVVWDQTHKRTAHGPLRTDRSVLQVAVARLLGYRWPAERDTEMELADEQRERVRRCESLSSCADEDGIVCIPPVRGEPSAGERLLRLLATTFGDGWHDGILAKILADAEDNSLDDWLRDCFFEQHCKLFHNRPFVWHIWDGRRRDGFHALVNYHKLADGGGKGRQLLESLTFSYLGDWITRQQDGTQRGEAGADDRLTAALELRTCLVAILHGEPPFDIFVRWKPIHQQPIGWEPDINDGVRLNIRPFMAEDLPGSKKGAGILRAKPNLHWRKDRGKEPFRDQEQFPWFWSAGEFTGDRVNDVHLTADCKRPAEPRSAQ